MPYGNTIISCLRASASLYPERTAFQFPDEDLSFTYLSFSQCVEQTARALLAAGAEKGSHIGIWSGNCSRWVALSFGAAAIGATIVPFNTSYQFEELNELCQMADLDLLFVMDRYQGKDCSRITEGFWNNGRIAARYHSLKAIVSLTPMTAGPHMSWDTFLSLGEAIEDGKLERAISAVSGDDIYSIQFTSGTTAKPKGAMLDQKGVLSTAAAYVDRLHFSEHEITCVPLPLFHCFGNVLTMLGAILSGSAVIYPESFRPIQTLALLEQAHCTALMAVPTMYVALMEQMQHTPCDLSSLHKAGVGGAYCPPSLGYEIAQRFQIPGLVIGYGLSEAASLCSLADVEAPSELRIESIGYPLSNLEVSLADPDTGLESPELIEGELVVRGTGVMRGYYNNRKETERALDQDGWLHTGDLGRRNPDGTFQFAGRLKDIIVRGGENISPSEIEDVLLTMEGVRDCQCVGVADNKYGEEIAACVILEKDAALTEQSVREYVQARLARYKTPRYVFFMETFPINGSGKIEKKELRVTAAELVKGSAHPDRP